jgi:hypothetical protein
MATVNLRPAVTKLDNALAWCARVRGLRRMSTPLARWTRRVICHIRKIHSQTFTPPDSDEYEMVQLWVSNGAVEDACAVQC